MLQPSLSYLSIIGQLFLSSHSDILQLSISHPSNISQLSPCSSQKGTKLLMALKRLKPEEADLWSCWQYFSRLPDWIQHQLVEDTSPVRELAKRVDELQRKVPASATVAVVLAPAPPAAEIATVA